MCVGAVSVETEGAEGQGVERANGADPVAAQAELWRLAATGSTEARCDLVTNPATPHGAFLVLASEGGPAVRIALARCGDVPAAALRIVADACDTKTGLITPNMGPLMVAASRATLKAWHVRYRDDIRRALVRNPSTPPDVLSRLAGEPDSFLRFWAAAHPGTPEDVREALESDPDPQVRQSLAEARTTPPNALRRLAEDSSPVVRTAVAVNPNTAPETIESLATDPEWPVRLAVAGRHDLPTKLVRVLMGDTNDLILAALQRNPTLGREFLVDLAIRAPEPIRRAATPNGTQGSPRRRVGGPAQLTRDLNEGMAP